jgi:hypothetical protein
MHRTSGKTTVAFLLPPAASPRAATRGCRIADNARAEGTQAQPRARRTGVCTSCIATAAAPLLSRASRPSRAGAIASILRVHKRDKSWLGSPRFRVAEYTTPSSVSMVLPYCNFRWIGLTKPRLTKRWRHSRILTRMQVPMVDSATTPLSEPPPAFARARVRVNPQHFQPARMQHCRRAIRPVICSVLCCECCAHPRNEEI